MNVVLIVVVVVVIFVVIVGGAATLVVGEVGTAAGVNSFCAISVRTSRIIIYIYIILIVLKLILIMILSIRHLADTRKVSFQKSVAFGTT